LNNYLKRQISEVIFRPCCTSWNNTAGWLWSLFCWVSFFILKFVVKLIQQLS